MYVSTFRFSSTFPSFTSQTVSPSLHSLNPPFLLLITLSFPSLLPFKRDSPLPTLQYLALFLSFTFCPSFLIIGLLIFIPLWLISVFYSLKSLSLCPPLLHPFGPPVCSFLPSIQQGRSILQWCDGRFPRSDRGSAARTVAHDFQRDIALHSCRTTRANTWNSGIAKDCNIKHKNVQRL